MRPGSVPRGRPGTCSFPWPMGRLWDPPPSVLHMLVGRGEGAGWVLPPPHPWGLLGDADMQQGPPCGWSSPQCRRGSRGQQGHPRSRPLCLSGADRPTPGARAASISRTGWRRGTVSVQTRSGNGSLAITGGHWASSVPRPGSRAAGQD